MTERTANTARITRNTLTALFALIALCFGNSIAEAQRGDSIIMKDGKPQTGTILSATPNAITATVRSRDTQIKVSEIGSINFEKEPSAMRSVREALRGGQVDQAVQAYQRIDASKISRDIVKQDVEFYNVEIKSLQVKEGSATAQEAIAAAKQFMQRYPKSWRTSAAMAALGELAMQTSDYKTAATTFARLANMAAGETKIRSMVRSGDALRSMNDTKNAMSMYRKALKEPSTTPQEARQKQLATVGAMSVAAAGGQAEQAIAKLKAVIKDNDASDVELFGKAYNALGDCYRFAKKPTDAALAYLHTDLLFYRDPEVHAESLYWLGKLWSELGKEERATAAKGMLRQRYPNSPWATK